MANENTAKSEDENKMEVDIRVRNGLRWGTLRIRNFIEQFPKQWVSTTNINHLATMIIDFNQLGTEIIEIPLKIRRVSVENINEKITTNGLYLLNIQIPAGVELSYERVRQIIAIQNASELKVIRVFLSPNIGIREAQNLIEEALTTGKIVEPVFDNLMAIEKFRTLYLFCLEKKLKLIGFISRGYNTINEALIMEFIRSRPDDKVVRHVSWIVGRTRAERDYIRSFVYYKFGFDFFVFQTKRGDPNVPINRIRQLSEDELIYVPLENFGICNCIAHEGQDCVAVAETYRRLRASSVPTSVHNIRTINDIFIDIFDALQRREDALQHFYTEEIEDAVSEIERLLTQRR